MPLSGVFETHDRPAGAGRRVQGQSAARHLRCARDCPTCRCDARFANLDAQFAHKAELHAIVPRALRARNTREHWLQRLEEQDLLCAPVRDMREALVDPQTLHNEMILEGTMRQRQRR